MASTKSFWSCYFHHTKWTIPLFRVTFQNKFQTRSFPKRNVLHCVGDARDYLWHRWCSGQKKNTRVWSESIKCTTKNESSSGKFLFSTSKVKLLSHKISKEGTWVDPEKMKTIKEFSRPQNVSDLRRLLSMANLEEHLTELTKPLWVLLKKETTWR